jgi:23S rRNA (cytidine1920-2'-O)/16S rRNA (cytidine1409-2'-O)-methyltransferase
VGRVRADVLLVERGLFDSRARARAAIEAGLVEAGGRTVGKPSELLEPGCTLVAGQPFAWVSRAGVKLDHALDTFGVAVAGRSCLDLGASTGGFTDVLLARGAGHVLAVDVGTGQLHPRLRAEPRVTLLESFDARALTASHLVPPPTLVVADLSFISLTKVLPQVLELVGRCAPSGSPVEAVVLVKPQFEAGPARVGRGGLVPPDLAPAIAGEVRTSLAGLTGLAASPLLPSPITGADGNREFLLHLSTHTVVRHSAPD